MFCQAFLQVVSEPVHLCLIRTMTCRLRKPRKMRSLQLLFPCKQQATTTKAKKKSLQWAFHVNTSWIQSCSGLKITHTQTMTRIRIWEYLQTFIWVWPHSDFLTSVLSPWRSGRRRRWRLGLHLSQWIQQLPSCLWSRDPPPWAPVKVQPDSVAHSSTSGTIPIFAMSCIGTCNGSATAYCFLSCNIHSTSKGLKKALCAGSPSPSCSLPKIQEMLRFVSETGKHCCQ